MRFKIFITLQIGPTIVEPDTQEVVIHRVAAHDGAVDDIQRAALALGATRVEIVDTSSPAYKAKEKARKELTDDRD